MDNLISMKPREKTRHEKLTEILGSSNYLTFHFTEAGALAYTFGEGMSDEQLAYLGRMLDIITLETIKANTHVEYTE